MHKRFIAEAKEKEPEVLIVGDSLMQQMAHNEMWDKMFVPLHCLNFGVGGDETQHVLWRLQNGELEDFAPKVIVICCGTNNTNHSADQIVGGILEIVKTCQKKQAQSQVIVMAIPPRGQFHNNLRKKLIKVNTEVNKQVTGIPNVSFFDVDLHTFVNPADGSISHQDMYDYLHLTRQGYRKLGEPLLEEIQTLLKNFLSADVISVSETEN